MRTNREIISFLIMCDVPMQADNVQEAQTRKLDRQRLKEERSDLLSQAHSNTQERGRPQPIKVEKKVGRNEPCPCGSGKKYKHCHGKAS